MKIHKIAEVTQGGYKIMSKIFCKNCEYSYEKRIDQCNIPTSKIIEISRKYFSRIEIYTYYGLNLKIKYILNDYGESHKDESPHIEKQLEKILIDNFIPKKNNIFGLPTDLFYIYVENKLKLDRITNEKLEIEIMGYDSVLDTTSYLYGKPSVFNFNNDCIFYVPKYKGE